MGWDDCLDFWGILSSTNNEVKMISSLKWYVLNGKDSGINNQFYLI